MRKQKLLPRIVSLLSIAAIFSFQLYPFSQSVSAAQIEPRALILLPGTTSSDVNGDTLPDGGSMPGGTANHQLQFDVPTSDPDIDTIVFEYCTTAAAVDGGLDCDPPTGLDATTATLGADGGTGWTITNQTLNTVTLSGLAQDLSGTKTFQLNDVINPSTTNTTFFIRISTIDTLGVEIDKGTVTASTATPIELEGTMPESLVFCTGETISLTAGVPDCATATPGNIGFSALFSPTATATATSQMAASTNAGSGYSITVNGPTMTSGTNTIAAMSTVGVSNLGVSQFGMNVVGNTGDTNNDGVVDASDDPTDPVVGSDIAPVTNGTNYNATAATGYDIDSQYKFAGGDVVATSNSLGTDSQIYTASYIVNVPGSQPAGTYATTLTYICTATF